MTPQEQKALTDAEAAHGSPPNNRTTALQAAGLGAASGATFGATGNISGLGGDISTQAQTEHPAAYGAGYAGGTGASLLYGGTVLKGLAALGTRGINAVRSIPAAATAAQEGYLAGKAPAMAGAIDEATAAKYANLKANPGTSPTPAMEAAAEQAGKPIAKEAPDAFNKITDWLKSISTDNPKSTTAAIQVVPRAAALGASSDMQPQKALPPAQAAGAPQASLANPEDNKAQQTASSVGQPSDQSNTDTQVASNDVPMTQPSFGTLSDWLAQAKQSNNPDVQNEAAQSLAAMQGAQDPGANRLIAMNLQKTANGRAVMNEDSPVNEEDQTA